MPRFYFDLTVGTELVIDDDGQELAGLDATVASALHSARGMMADDVRGGSLDLTPKLQVADADHAPVHSLNFADAVAIRPPGPTQRPS